MTDIRECREFLAAIDRKLASAADREGKVQRAIGEITEALTPLPVDRRRRVMSVVKEKLQREGRLPTARERLRKGPQ